MGERGRGSVATPGFLAGLNYARQKYGSHEVNYGFRAPRVADPVSPVWYYPDAVLNLQKSGIRDPP
mgnify:CR=1 FL=1